MKLDHVSKICKQQRQMVLFHFHHLKHLLQNAHFMQTLRQSRARHTFTDRFYENLRSRPEKSGAITRSPSLSVLKRSEDKNMPSPQISCQASVQNNRKWFPFTEWLLQVILFPCQLWISLFKEALHLENIAKINLEKVCSIQNKTGDLKILSLQSTE